MIFNTGLNALNILFHILFHRKLYCSFWDEGKQLIVARGLFSETAVQLFCKQRYGSSYTKEYHVSLKTEQDATFL